MSVNLQGKIYAIENLRGIAAVMVLICHVGALQHFLNLGFTINFQLGVQLFFAISGFIIPYSMFKSNYELKDLKFFLLRRIYRIEPPYLISIILMLIVLQFVALKTTTFSWFDIVVHLGYLVPFFENAKWVNHVFWTLAIEFQFYIFIAFVFPLLLKSNKYIAISICFLMLLLVLINIPGIKNDEMLYRHIHHFSIGIFTFLFFIKRINKIEFFLGLILYAILGKFFISYIHATISIFSSLTILFLNKKNIIGSFLGKISYSLYITHSISLLIIVKYLGFVFSPSTHYINAMFLMVIVLFCIGIGYVFFRLVELPFLKLSKKVHYPK